MSQGLNIPITILQPAKETSYINHDGDLVLTYDVFRSRDHSPWIDLDEGVAFGTTYMVTSKLRFNFVPGGDSLLSQLIATARTIHNPLILGQSWEMRTEPSGTRSFIRAFICQVGKPKDANPQLRFCENTLWREDCFSP